MRAHDSDFRSTICICSIEMFVVLFLLLLLSHLSERALLYGKCWRAKFCAIVEAVLPHLIDRHNCKRTAADVCACVRVGACRSVRMRTRISYGYWLPIPVPKIAFSMEIVLLYKYSTLHIVHIIASSSHAETIYTWTLHTIQLQLFFLFFLI